MPQAIVYLDEEEDKKVREVAYKYQLSKAEAIKQIIRSCIIDDEKQ